MNSWRSLEPGSLDFANILFAGPCNRSCPWCIGKQLDPAVNVDNLRRFPPAGFDELIEAVNALEIRQIVFTGTVSDPQLYRFQRELLDALRARLKTNPVISIHTNGVLTLRQLETFNSYDKSCISFPSFRPKTYGVMMGHPAPPDLEAIIRAAGIEVKVSCVLDDPNFAEIDEFLERCEAIGVRRLVFRRLFGDMRPWKILEDRPVEREFRKNPVYRIGEMEVTVWSFTETSCRSINLFPDGFIGPSYLLSDSRPLISPPEKSGATGELQSFG